MFTPADREALLRRVLAMLEGDERLEGAMVTGSLGSGRADRWSDIDLACVVAEGEDCATVTSAWVARLQDELPVVHHYVVEFGSTLVRGLLLEDGLLLDLAFAPSADLSIWAPVTIAFDRSGRLTDAAAKPQSWTPSPDWSGEAGLAAHDVIHAATALLRHQPWRALLYVQRVRNRTLSLASERHGWDADEFARVDELPSDERDPLLGSLVGDLEPATLSRALDAATRAFLVELKRGDRQLAERLEPVLTAWVAETRHAARSEPPSNLSE